MKLTNNLFEMFDFMTQFECVEAPQAKKTCLAGSRSAREEHERDRDFELGKSSCQFVLTVQTISTHIVKHV